ncbi:hypothetical protein PMIN04_001494 [Paraphaeosphaeria minitans]
MKQLSSRSETAGADARSPSPSFARIPRGSLSSGYDAVYITVARGASHAVGIAESGDISNFSCSVQPEEIQQLKLLQMSVSGPVPGLEVNGSLTDVRRSCS